MTLATSAPFRIPGKDRVLVQSWWILDGGQAVEAPEALPHWDPLTRIDVRCDLVLDLDGLRADCDLGKDSRFGLILRWQSAGTSIRGTGPMTLISKSTRDITLTAEIPGSDVAQSVRCDAHVLFWSGRPKSVVAPSVTGTVLWTASKEVVLEGIGSRFPVEFCDFNDRGWLPSDAGWYLDWDPEQPEQPFLRGVRLLINTRHSAVSSAVAGHGAVGASPRDRAIVESVHHDVARVMILGILRNNDFVRGPDAFPEGSVGRTLARLIRTLFQGERMPELAERAKSNPFRLECELQERLSLFERGAT
jgi:hypothetical protein